MTITIHHTIDADSFSDDTTREDIERYADMCADTIAREYWRLSNGGTDVSYTFTIRERESGAGSGISVVSISEGENGRPHYDADNVEETCREICHRVYDDGLFYSTNTEA